MPPLLLVLKPSSIMVRNATGRLSEALEDTASASSQATNRPRWRRTNGHNARNEPKGGLVGALDGAATGEFIRAC